ncbi:MAG: hypothetical protein ABIT82_09790 [Ramlibacter sp.]
METGLQWPHHAVAGPCRALDCQGTSARFRRPTSPSIDPEGNVFLKDGELVRKITPQGLVSTVAGTPCRVGTGIGDLPGTLGDGPLEPFVLGERLTFGRDGILYVESDKALLKIRFK